MDCAWRKYQEELSGDIEFADNEVESPVQAGERGKQAFIPCAGKIDGKYVLSEIARYHGFAALERFFQLVCREMGSLAPSETFDSLRVLANACQRKRSKSKSKEKPKEGRWINERRTCRRAICRFCGRKTELTAYIEGAEWPTEDNRSRLRLSTMYCNEHKPKKIFTDLVRPEYLKVLRSQSNFYLEVSRLERQGWSDTSVPRAKSGNKLIDEYIRRFVARRLQNFSFDVVRYLLDQKYASSLDQKLREEARMLVDRKISDRKKEMMMLLASGFNQAETGRRLGITRQAVCKVLPTIDENYRLDLWTAKI